MNMRGRRADDAAVVDFPREGVVVRVERDERASECSAVNRRNFIRPAQLRGVSDRTAADERELAARRPAATRAGVDIDVEVVWVRKNLCSQIRRDRESAGERPVRE